MTAYILAALDQAHRRNNPFPSLPLVRSPTFIQTFAMTASTRLRRWLACIVLAALPLAAMAADDTYRYDTVHSQILFSISHNGYSRPFGRLHIAKGWLRFDPKAWDRAATELDIDLGSLDMGDAAWNQAVLKPGFLDGAGQRYAHFVSTSVERKDDSHGILHGQLTLKGVTRNIEISFTVNRIGTTVYGMHKVAGFSGIATLDRNEFGMTSNPNAIGSSVSIWLELEAIQDDNAGKEKETP